MVILGDKGRSYRIPHNPNHWKGQHKKPTTRPLKFATQINLSSSLQFHYSDQQTGNYLQSQTLNITFHIIIQTFNICMYFLILIRLKCSLCFRWSEAVGGYWESEKLVRNKKQDRKKKFFFVLRDGGVLKLCIGIINSVL